jgi:hypothetical protein
MSQESQFICVDHGYYSNAIPCQQCADARVAAIARPRNDVFENLKTAIVRELEARDQRGFENHGRPLLTNDGMDTLWEAYEEQLDALVYLRKALMEQQPWRFVKADLGGRCVR